MALKGIPCPWPFYILNPSSSFANSSRDHDPMPVLRYLGEGLRVLRVVRSSKGNETWQIIFSSLVVVHILSVLWKYWWKAPSKIYIHAWPTPLGRWLTALRMILDAERLLEQAYDKADGRPFAIPMTDRWIVFVSGRSRLEKLQLEPESILSLEDALHELGMTEPILGNLQALPEHNGPKSESFRVVNGVLKNKLRAELPSMNEALHERIEQAIALEFSSSGEVYTLDGKWNRLHLYPAVLRTFTRLNLLAFFGERLAKDPQIHKIVMKFFWSCIQAFALLMLLPDFPCRDKVIGCVVARREVFNLLARIIHESRSRRGHERQELGQSQSLLKWISEMTRFEEVIPTAKIALGLLFASAFQVPMLAQYCIFNLCSFPDYLDRLREEALGAMGQDLSTSKHEMPYMDSFIKETARLSPGPLVTAPRTARTTYKSPVDGYIVPKGNWIAVPQFSVMRDEHVWSDAAVFHPFRFVDDTNGTSRSRLTHPSYEFPFWGSIQHACPARFFVSVTLKMMLAHLIVGYDVRLASPSQAAHITVGKLRLPNPFLQILVRKRKDSGAVGKRVL